MVELNPLLQMLPLLPLLPSLTVALHVLRPGLPYLRRGR